MKEVMTFQEAALDPNRPLSVTPREWMYAVQAQMSEQKELVDKVVKRIAVENKKQITSTGLQKIELGVDQIVSGIKIVIQGLQEADLANLRPEERKVVSAVKDLIDTAISPYTVDIIEQLDKLEIQ